MKIRECYVLYSQSFAIGKKHTKPVISWSNPACKEIFQRKKHKTRKYDFMDNPFYILAHTILDFNKS